MLGGRLAVIGLWVLWMLLLPCAAQASTASTFERRTWGQSDGAPQSAYGLAQDADGMLWFATVTGLYNFDGHHFRRVDTVHGHALRSNNLVAVVATRDGIAVGYQFGGVSVFSRNGVRHFKPSDGLPSGSVGCLVMDSAGTLYAGSTTGMAKLGPDDATWQPLPPLHGQANYINWIGIDAGATMWVMAESKLYARPKDSAGFRQVTTLPYAAIPSIVGGELVAYTSNKKLTRFSSSGHATVVPAGTDFINQDTTLFDGPGATVWGWIKGGTASLRTGADGALEIAQSFEGGALPGRMVSRTLLDRENNLWVATLEGVERYRMHRLHALPLPSTVIGLLAGQGLADDILVASGNDGPVWQALASGMQALPGLTGVSTIHKQDAGSVWLGGTWGLYHLTPKGLSHWPLPLGTPLDLGIQGIVTDKTGAVWVSITRRGLFRFLDGAWTKYPSTIAGGDETPVVMATGASGTTYLGYTGGRLGELTPGGIRMLATSLAEQVGNVLALLEQGGMLLVGGDRGVVAIERGVVRPLRPARLSAFLGISGMALDRHGDLWLHGPDGLFRIDAPALRGFRSRHTDTVEWEVFNFEDGLRGQIAQIRPLPSLIAGNDGRIYYATSSQVGWIDPASIRRNARPPTVLVQSIRSGNVVRDARPGMTLAAGTTSVDIGFAATALSIPERVRFRYRLAGVEQDWQQAQYERAARYTNLGPGNYRFHVTAANEDGAWNDRGAVLDFRILPQFWETTWFRTIAIAVSLLLILALYRWRIATATRRAAERTAARMEERERIARNLHDHLLQGVQGFVLNCHAVLIRMQAGSSEEKSLSQALARADRMIEETRDEVMNLRGELPPHQLAGRLDATIATFGAAMGERIHLELGGDIGRLTPQVANEVLYVLQEAIVNGARYSGADAIRVVLEAGDAALDGSVIDDGCGVEQAILAHGKAGHWGLTGMRERVERLGGSLSIDSGQGLGTAVRFSIPARRAYGG